MDPFGRGSEVEAFNDVDAQFRRRGSGTNGRDTLASDGVAAPITRRDFGQFSSWIFLTSFSAHKLRRP